MTTVQVTTTETTVTVDETDVTIGVNGPTVDSVNGQVGTVVLDAADVGTYTLAEIDALVSAAGAVDSVNGQTGVVVLTASDVSAYTQAETDALLAALLDIPGADARYAQLAAANTFTQDQTLSGARMTGPASITTGTASDNQIISRVLLIDPSGAVTVPTGLFNGYLYGAEIKIAPTIDFTVGKGIFIKGLRSLSDISAIDADHVPTEIDGIEGITFWEGPGKAPLVIGFNLAAESFSADGAGRLIAAYLEVSNFGGTVDNAYGLFLDEDFSSATITNKYGIYLSDLHSAHVTNAVAINTEGGETRHKTGAAATKGVVIQRHAAQTADLLVLLDSDGTTVLGAFDKDGLLPQANVSGLVAALAAKASSASLTSHTSDTANPHSVTAAQVGAYTTAAADTLLAAKAPLASPALTGTPTAPTAAGGTNTTQVATTAFVAAGFQPLDSDLAAIAALSTTSYGRSLLEAADAAAARSTLGTSSSASAFEFFDDFLFGLAVATSTTGTGASASINSLVTTDAGGHPGLMGLDTGTTTSGRGAIAGGGSALSLILFGNGAVVYETDVYLNDAVSDGTDTYAIFVGFNDSITVTGTDAIMFRYTHSVNSGKWQCVTRSNGVETGSATDSGVTVASTTWYKLRIEVNAAGTSVAFYINGALVATNTANIPTGAGRQTGPFLGIVKSAGANARRLLVDYLYCRIDLTVAR